MFISVDPGAVHCGVAVWESPDESETGLYKCRESFELTPDQCVDYVRGRISRLEGVACESFFLRPGRQALQQAGSSFGMVEVIGTIRNLCRWNDVDFLMITPQDRSATYKRLSAAGYRFASKAQAEKDHRVAAECAGAGAMKLRIADLLPHEPVNPVG